MNELDREGWQWLIWFAAALAFIGAMGWLVFQSVGASRTEETKRMNLCVQFGGSWIVDGKAGECWVLDVVERP